MEQQEPPQAVKPHWSAYVSMVVAIVTVAFAVFVSPAAAAYRGNLDTIQSLQLSIQQLLEHQKQQDNRVTKLEDKMDLLSEKLNNIDKQTALSARTLDWMSSWIKSGGQK